MQTKTEKIKLLLEADETIKAISLASKFFDRGEDTRIFKQAQSAANNPGFYRQMGKDPKAIITKAIERLEARFT